MADPNNIELEGAEKGRRVDQQSNQPISIPRLSTNWLTNQPTYQPTNLEGAGEGRRESGTKPPSQPCAWGENEEA